MTMPNGHPRSPSRQLVPLFVIIALAIGTLGIGPALGGTLRDPLPAVLAEAAPEELIPVSIVLKEQVARAQLIRLGEGKTKAERRAAVTEALKARARQSQAGILAALRADQAAGQVGPRLRPLWIGNVIGVDATRSVIERIAALPQVDHVNHNPKVDVFLGGPQDQCVDLPVRSELFPPLAGLAPGSTTAAASPCPEGNEIECGTSLMRAPEVWTEFGQTGEGIVVAVIDTGVCYTHPDIVNQIWVNPGEDNLGDGIVMDPNDMDGTDDDGNGFVDDLIGWNFDLGHNDPNDTNSHGSHVAGTVAGDGTSGTCAGMAPDAQIMVIRVGVTFADEVDVWNAMQYAADNGADLISMSLGWPHNQNPDRATWRTNCDNTTAAGTTMIVAAGNEGSGNEPDNVRTPGDVPIVIGIGATNCSDTAAGFSSRGPVTWQNVSPYNDYPYPPGLIKPEVSAPGVSTESHNLCSGYSFKSGTSMATPHTAGASALVLQADPSLNRDELHDALASTSIDLGEAGKDNTYGAGRVDVYEAVRTVAGKIRYVSHGVDDSNPDLGNNDGGVDLGETIVLPVTVLNRGETTATGVHGFLSTTTPGISIRDGYAVWPALAPSAQAPSQPPHFSFRVDATCGDTIEFRLEIGSDSGDTSISTFQVRVGTAQPVIYFDDDFETDLGWTASSAHATSGFWVREDPNESTHDGEPAQPDDDATPSPGVTAWITENPRITGGQSAKDADVDGGRVTLTSPTIDASDADTLQLDLNRWFALLDPASADASSLTISISGDNGGSWNPMETLTANQNTWVQRTFDVLAFASATSQMKIRIEAEESFTFPTIGADSLVEALIDDVRLHGTRIVCESFTPPSLQAPNPVGNTLEAERDGGHVRLTWAAPPVDASHDRATLYRVLRSETPDGTFVEIGAPTSELFVDQDAALGPPNGYYKVQAENNGGSSGE
jgi:serine protease AprX